MKPCIWYLEIGLDTPPPPPPALNGQIWVIKLAEYFNKPFKSPIF